MTKKTRLIILLFCVVCFLVIAPVLVAYSMGYRFDLEKRKIVGTGGIYVRTFPAAEQIIIDSKISVKPGVFSNAIFVQSLLPKEHTVSITKKGYYDYFKTLEVKEKEVTKLENITLFKKNIAFTGIQNEVTYFSIAPDNQKIISVSESVKTTTLNYFSLSNPSQQQELPIKESAKILDIKWSGDSNYALIKMQDQKAIFYYFFDSVSKTRTFSRLAYLDKNSELVNFNPINALEIFYVENQILYALKNNEPNILIRGLVAYSILGNNILWLSQSGALEQSDTSGKLISDFSESSIKIKSGAEHQLISDSGKIFLQDKTSLFLFDENTKIFENLNAPQGLYKIINSPDNQNLILWNENKIYLYSISGKIYELIYSGSNITNCQWLNNNYIILTSGNDIIISEIDYRGNINALTLPETLDIGENKTIKIENPQTLFIPQNGKLYILADRILLASEKILP